MLDGSLGAQSPWGWDLGFGLIKLHNEEAKIQHIMKCTSLAQFLKLSVS